MRKSLLYFLLSFLLQPILAQVSGYDSIQSSLSQGWNTWSYKSMLEHVLLPQNLSVKVNLRQGFIATPEDPYVLLDKVFPDSMGWIKPVAHTWDGSYTEVVIDGWKGHTIRIQTSVEQNKLYILVSPIKTSTVQFQFEVPVGFLWNSEGHVVKLDDGVQAITETDTISIKSTASLVEVFQPYQTPYFVVNGSDESFAIYTGEQLDLATIKKKVEIAERNYHNYAEKFGSLADGFKALQSVLAWNTIYDPMKDRVISPVTRAWNEAWQGSVLFNWDTYFASFLFALDNKELAYSNALEVTKYPHESGSIGHYQMGDGTVSLMSQPPVGSTICWMLYQKYQEEWFVEAVYENLLRWNEWWIENRLNGDYLTWGGWKGANSQIAAWESGLDNSPMYDDLDMRETADASLIQLADVGLQSLYVADCKALAKMAKLLGRKQDAKDLGRRAVQFEKLTESLWSEEEQSYLNKVFSSNSFSNQKSPTLFYPLISEIPSEKRAEQLLNAHFLNPDEFYGTYTLPSISYDNPKYDNIYWRGAIWPPMNFLIYLGLRNYRPDLATELADRSYNLFLTAWKKHHAVFENINSAKGVENVSDQLMADTYYHWGALMGIMKFMEKGYYEAQN